MGQRGEQGQHVPHAPSVLKRAVIPALPCDGLQPCDPQLRPEP